MGASVDQKGNTPGDSKSLAPAKKESVHGGRFEYFSAARWEEFFVSVFHV